MSTRKIICTPLLILMLLLPWKGRGQVADQQLVVGRAKTLTTAYEVGDIAMSNVEICSFVVRENRREIYLNPLTEGSTTLTIWDTEGKKRDSSLLTVVAVDVDAGLKAAQDFTRNIPGVRVYLEGSTVVLGGEVHTPAHLKQLEGYAETHPEARSEVKLSSQAMNVIAKRIEEAINTPGIQVRAVRDKLIMEGLTYSDDIYKKIDTIAKLYAPEIINLVEVREANRRPGYDKTVRFDIYFMEVKNSALRAFGINWAPGAVIQQQAEKGGGSGGGGFLGGGFNAMIGFVMNLVPKIRWIHQTGRGRILEKPSFIVKSGEPVNFFSGTQVPYYGEQGVSFKEVGIKVNAEPIAAGDEIDLKVTVDVSTLSSTVAEGIDTNNVTTSVFVKSGQAVVLGGLVRNADVKTYNKVPKNLDTTSAIFTLFLSRDFQTNKSQFYVFLVPEVLEQPQAAEMKLKRWLEINKEIELSRKFK
ncbi:MAG: pilus assembly protein N-terminal domain-containing protein [Deltaproteobacteria bacterium]|nr:pilus assembly protein N-terminal domain-containing protein [Deltaproteobacteria bacterium]